MTDSEPNCKTIIVITGPTASGKTAVAIELARRYNGEVINADSMQLYQDLPILTARPQPHECAYAPHHLYGTLGFDADSSAMIWRQLACTKITDIERRGRVPILCGGTGLYLKALLDGLSPIPPIPSQTRQQVRDWVAEIGVGAASAWLKRIDPVTANRLYPTDKQRLTRAIEVWQATGQSLSFWQSQKPREPGLRSRAAICVLCPDRTRLIQTCHQRFDQMIIRGAVQEVADLLKRGAQSQDPIFRVLGARNLAAAIQGECSLDQAITDSKTATRRYAKRQVSWNKTQIGSAYRVYEQDLASFMPDICNYITNISKNTLRAL